MTLGELYWMWPETQDVRTFAERNLRDLGHLDQRFLSCDLFSGWMSEMDPVLPLCGASPFKRQDHNAWMHEIPDNDYDAAPKCPDCMLIALERDYL